MEPAEYSQALREFSDDPRAVGYNGPQSQDLMFSRFLQLFKFERDQIRVHEVGCGLCHFKEYLKNRRRVLYSGNDTLRDMVVFSRQKHPETAIYHGRLRDNLQFLYTDYVVAITTFNESPKEELLDELQVMYAAAKKGIAFDCFSSYVDFIDKKITYIDPAEMLSFCLQTLSRHVFLDHSLPNYRYVVFVYKPAFIDSIYPNKSQYFAKK